MKRLEQLAYEKGYRVSDSGQPLSPTGKMLKGTLSGKKPMRYLAIAIKYVGEDGVTKKKNNCKVHRLQAFQKYGDAIFGEGIVVRHLDGNRFNNSSENILIGTARDNIMDMPAETRKRKARIAANHNPSKHPEEIVLEIKKDRAAGMTYKQLMRKYGIRSKGTISYMCNHDYQ